MKYGNKRYYSGLLRLIFIIAIVFVCQVSFGCCVFAEEADRDGVIDEQAGSDEIGKIENQLSKYSDGDIQAILNDYDPRNIIKDAAKGKFEFSFKGILNGAVQYVFKEIYLNIHILVEVIVLVILCALLKNLQTSFLSENVAELAFYVCYMVIVSVMVVSFSSALEMGIKMIDSMVGFMYATVPALITLLISGGNITSGGVFQPVLIMIVEVSATIFKNVFIPLVFLSTILSIVNNISDKVQITKLAEFLKQITGWGLGLILTIFIAVITIQGSLGAVVDGITSKTAKYAIGAFVPVVGKYLADAADTVIGCTLLIKNAAGVAVMIGIVAICIVPFLKMGALVVLYRITCVLVEPISEKRITGCISSIAGSLTMLLGIVASVAFMFLISVTAIIGASNLSAMVR